MPRTGPSGGLRHRHRAAELGGRKIFSLFVPSFFFVILSEPAAAGESKDPNPTLATMLPQGILAMHRKVWVYIVAGRAGTLYIDMTNALEVRARQHKAGEMALIERTNPKRANLPSKWGVETRLPGQALS